MSAKNILVVEDDPHVSAALVTRLRAAGYEVLAAPGPHVGGTFARSLRPDLIITDVLMPTMNGLEFIRRLKQSGMANVPFMVITASFQNDLWESAMELGATAYFEKPYDGAKLLNAVDEVLKQHEANSNTKGDQE